MRGDISKASRGISNKSSSNYNALQRRCIYSNALVIYSLHRRPPFARRRLLLTRGSILVEYNIVKKIKRRLLGTREFRWPKLRDGHLKKLSVGLEVLRGVNEVNHERGLGGVPQPLQERDGDAVVVGHPQVCKSAHREVAFQEHVTEPL